MLRWLSGEAYGRRVVGALRRSVRGHQALRIRQRSWHRARDVRRLVIMSLLSLVLGWVRTLRHDGHFRHDDGATLSCARACEKSGPWSSR